MGNYLGSDKNREGFHFHHFQAIRVEGPWPPQPKFTALAAACKGGQPHPAGIGYRPKVRGHASSVASKHAAGMAGAHPNLSGQTSMQDLPPGRPWKFWQKEKHKLDVENLWERKQSISSQSASSAQELGLQSFDFHTIYSKWMLFFSTEMSQALLSKVAGFTGLWCPFQAVVALSGTNSPKVCDPPHKEPYSPPYSNRWSTVLTGQESRRHFLLSHHSPLQDC